MEESIWNSSNDNLKIGKHATLYADGKSQVYIATPQIASASVKKTDNPVLFFGGFTVSLVGLVLFSFDIPTIVVSGVVGTGVLLFLLSLVIRKSQFVISSNGGDSIEIPLSKISKDEIDQAIEAIHDCQSQPSHQEVSLVDGGNQNAGSIGRSSGKKAFKALTPKK